MPKYLTIALPAAKLSRRKALFAVLGANVSFGASALTEPSRTNCRTLVLGVGGMGNSVAQQMASTLESGLEFAAVHRREDDLRRSSIAKGIVISSWERRQATSAACPVAQEAIERVRSLVVGIDVLVVVAAMNGSAGGAIAPVVGRVARHAGIYTIGAITTPADWEGARQSRLAKLNAWTLSASVDGMVTVDQERLFDDPRVEELTHEEYLAHSNAELIGGIQAVLRFTPKSARQSAALSISAR